MNAFISQEEVIAIIYFFPLNKDSLDWYIQTLASVGNACILILIPLLFREILCNPREST